MLVALAISHLLMPSALTLQDYHYLCLWLVRNINKNPINLSFSLVETGKGTNVKKHFTSVIYEITNVRKKLVLFHSGLSTLV